MRQSQHYTLAAGLRSQGFHDRNGVVIGNAVTATLRARLDSGVAALQAYQVEQRTETGLARGMTSVLKEKRDAIHKQFGVPIRRVADSALSTTPEYLSLLLPSRAPRHGDFLAMATVLGAAAAVHEQVFLDHGLQTDFLVRLNAAVVDLARATCVRSDHKGRSVAARAGLKAADQEVKDALAIMDSTMKDVLSKDASLLAGWEASRKIHITTTPLPNLGLIGPAAA